MKKFYEVLKEFRGLLAWPLGASGILPILAQLSGLLPVNMWPTVIASSFGSLLVVCWMFMKLPSKSKAHVERVMGRSLILTIVSFTVFSFMLYQFTTVVPNKDKDRVVLGCGWNNDALLVLEEYGMKEASGCPGNKPERILDRFDHKPSEVYSRSGLTLINLSLGISFATAFLSLASFLAAFVVYNVAGRGRDRGATRRRTS